MFYYLEGTVAHMEAGLAVIDCNGVGFALGTTTNTLSQLRTGERAKLFTYTHIRENSFDLCGFYTLNEKRSFELLISVSGVGMKAALSILSASTPESLAMAIISEDEKALTVAPGIGKKIAQRIILELKDKISKETQGISIPSTQVHTSQGNLKGDKWNDAISALAVLGYSNVEIVGALRDVDCDALSLEEIIRAALRNMMKS